MVSETLITQENKLYQAKESEKLLGMNTLDLKAGHQSHTPLIYGHFLSNNLVLYLKKDGILVSNVNEPLQYIHSLNLSKF